MSTPKDQPHLLGPAWRPSPWAGAAQQVISAIPDGAEIGAVNFLAPQLTARFRVYRFPQALDSDRKPEWLLVSDSRRGGMPIFDWELPYLANIPALGYRLVKERSGIQLYRLVGPVLV